jgi:hypothetical protein
MSLRRSVLLKNLKESLDPRNFPFAPLEIAAFIRDFNRFKQRYRGKYPVRLLPVLYEKTTKSVFDPHYVYQAYWAARELRQWPPTGQHLDISSHVPFAVQLSASFPVLQLEYRPPRIDLASYQKIAGDMLRLPFRNRSLSSITCLHAIEHLGLGRYGDPLDPNGCWRGLYEIERVLATNGNLFLSVPVGRPALYFNGNYVFRAADIPGALRGLKLVSFSYVNDEGRFMDSGKVHETDKMSYALGLFHFRKPLDSKDD